MNPTDSQIRQLQTKAMNGSPLAESCAVALGELVLDGTDAEVEREVACERIAEFIKATHA